MHLMHIKWNKLAEIPRLVVCRVVHRKSNLALHGFGSTDNLYTQNHVFQDVDIL
jgi:hypothetical protein